MPQSQKKAETDTQQNPDALVSAADAVTRLNKANLGLTFEGSGGSVTAKLTKDQTNDFNNPPIDLAKLFDGPASIEAVESKKQTRTESLTPGHLFGGRLSVGKTAAKLEDSDHVLVLRNLTERKLAEIEKNAPATRELSGGNSKGVVAKYNEIHPVSTAGSGHSPADEANLSKVEQLNRGLESVAVQFTSVDGKITGKLTNADQIGNLEKVVQAGPDDTTPGKLTPTKFFGSDSITYKDHTISIASDISPADLGKFTDGNNSKAFRAAIEKGDPKTVNAVLQFADTQKMADQTQDNHGLPATASKVKKLSGIFQH